MEKLTTFPVPELDILEENYISIAMELEMETISSDKDRIQLSNLLNEAEEKVNQLEDADEKAAFLNQIEEVRKHARELLAFRGGLALYMTQNDIYYYHLNYPPTTFSDVGIYPNFRPLVENFQFTNDYHVLVLSREEFLLFEGNYRSIDRIEITDEDAPTTLEKALGTEKSGGELTHGTFGSRGTAGHHSYHGHNETSNEKDIDRENYFRIVDNYIYENFSLDKELDLILFALPENQTVFRELSKNQFLIDDCIEESGTRLTQSEIEKKVIDKHHEIVESQKIKILQDFNETKPEFRVDNHLDDLANNGLQGRIRELLIGRTFKQNGSISGEGMYVEDDSNFVKQLVAKVVQMKGNVYLIDDEEMPEGINISARLRY